MKIYKFPKRIFILEPLIVFFVLAAVFTSFYTINETEQGVITTFGNPTSIVDAGLHFKLPFRIQEVKKVPVNITQKLTIGYYSDENGNIVSDDEESMMITGDYNLINIDFFVEWKISDPIAYLYNSNNPELILRNITMAAARNVVGSCLVDDVLTTGKEAIQSNIEDVVRENLDIYDIGVGLQDIKIQDSEPPTAEVNEAFKAVEEARQNKEKEINNAKAYQNKVIPEAQSEADKIIKEAEAYKESRIAEASGEVSKFNAMYQEFAAFPEITKTRMYLEAIEDILPNVKIYVNTSDGTVQSLLPLETFTNLNQGNS